MAEKPKKSDMAELRELSQIWSRGKRIFGSYFETLPTVHSTDGLKQFQLREDPKPLPPPTKELFEDVITESDAVVNASYSMEFSISTLKQMMLEEQEDKIARVDKRLQKAQKRGDNTENLEAKRINGIQKLEEMQTMSPNRWAAKARKAAQALWFGTVMGLGEALMEKEEQLRTESRSKQDG